MEEDPAARRSQKRGYELSPEDEEEEQAARLGRREADMLAEVMQQAFWSEKGEPLDRQATLDAMQRERDSLAHFGTFRRITRAEAKQRNLKVVKSRWLLVQKPDKVKARLVAQEVAFTHRDDCWAGTPTSVGQRLLLRRSLQTGWSTRQGDIATAFLHAKSSAGVAVVPPPTEDVDPDELWECVQSLLRLAEVAG